MNKDSAAGTNAVLTLRNPATVRARCEQVLALARAGKAKHFSFHEDRLKDASRLTIEATRAAYPDLNVPYHSRWRHFESGGIDRWELLRKKLPQDKKEQARIAFELTITSVLLDAGAGANWSYKEAASGQSFARSEGLAVASFDAYLAGAFSKHGSRDPYRADVEGLHSFNEARFNDAFQVRSDNPIVGGKGRAALVASLAESMRLQPAMFPGSEARIGNFFDHVLTRVSNGRIEASSVLLSVLSAFENIWPGRIVVNETNMGDVWEYDGIKTSDATNHLIPFHKLSQWLSYSLFEPLEAYGIEVVNLDNMTGLPEYRNGGLLLDTGVLVAKDPAQMNKEHLPSSEFIVEWRALTVALLDQIAIQVRKDLGLDAKSYPLAKVLQGGTWTAGRMIAKAKRPGGTPPLNIVSDGTVF